MVRFIRREGAKRLHDQEILVFELRRSGLSLRPFSRFRVRRRVKLTLFQRRVVLSLWRRWPSLIEEVVLVGPRVLTDGQEDLAMILRYEKSPEGWFQK